MPRTRQASGSSAMRPTPNRMFVGVGQLPRGSVLVAVIRAFPVRPCSDRNTENIA